MREPEQAAARGDIGGGFAQRGAAFLRPGAGNNAFPDQLLGARRR